MKKFRNVLAFACLSFFVNKNFFAAGPTVELIAADQSSHVCKIGAYCVWNVLSGTGTFNKLVKFRTESFQIAKNNVEFKADWLNYNAGIQFAYTRFFNRRIGWNVLDVKGGYNQYATYSLPEKNSGKGDKKNTSNIKNSLNYSGLSFDVLSGVAINLWEDGLDFEEGNQFGNRFVFNFNAGVNFNLCSFSIKGEPAFKEKFLEAHFADTSQLLRILFEPSAEWVLRNGFYSRVGYNFTFLGPWKAERRRDKDFSLKENKTEKLGGTVSFAPMLGFGWDFSALIN